VRTLMPGLDAVNMTARESLHQYALLVLKYEAVYRALFDNRAVRGFLSAVPGLDAYAMLGKAWWHTTELASAGAPSSGSAGRSDFKYDLVILDGPASGHAITMLKIPGAILSTMPAGPLAKDARALNTLLADPKQAALVIVTRAEELPAKETVELVQAAKRLPGLCVGPVIVNAMPSETTLNPTFEALLDRLPDPVADPALGEVVALARAARTQARIARQIFEQLRVSPGLPMVALPALPKTSLSLAEVDVLASKLA